jgi:NADH-quinone oxidoreductase subunit H
MPPVDYIPFLHWPQWIEGLIVMAVLYIPFVSLVAMFSIWWERKVSAHIQSRMGPMRTGKWHGWAQSPADGLKLFGKEDLIPRDADGPLFRLATYLTFVPAFAALVVLPFSARFVFTDLSVSLVFLFGILSLEVLGVILAGWASNSKWALFGAMREACQMVSYEIPMGLSLLVPALTVGSLSLSGIGAVQGGGLHKWLVFHDPFLFGAFVIFFIATLASCKRAPFDLPESESELVAGFLTEYSGMRWAMFFFAEYIVMFIVGAMASLLFLGAWYDPFGIVYWMEQHGQGWWAAVLGTGVIVVKGFAMVFVQMWVRWTLPRLRIDQVMYLCIKVLLPLAVVDLVGSAAWVALVPATSAPYGFIQSGVQIALALVGTAAALYFAGVLGKSILAPKAGILLSMNTPWNLEREAAAPTPPASSAAPAAGAPTNAG